MRSADTLAAGWEDSRNRVGLDSPVDPGIRAGLAADNWIDFDSWEAALAEPAEAAPVAVTDPDRATAIGLWIDRERPAVGPEVNPSRDAIHPLEQGQAR